MLCLAFLPNSAQARPLVGVGDNGPAMFADQNFQSLGTKISRKIVPFDFYRSQWEIDQLRAWMAGAQSQGVEPLIAFERSYTSPRKLPSVAEYKFALRTLLQEAPGLSTFSVWNEANHHSQPTVKNPRRAAQYFKAARQICAGCKIVAGDVLDQKNMLAWVGRFKRAAGPKARIWGLHSYADANYSHNWRRSATRRLLAVIKGDLWLTEVGGIVAFSSHFRYNEYRAADAIRDTLALAGKSPRIKRVYLYSWFGTKQSHSARKLHWDSGLVDAAGNPRPGFRVLRDWLAAN